MKRGRNRPRVATWVAVALLLVLGSTHNAFALNPALEINQYAHTAWRIRDGFFAGVIQSIAQTSDGYLWLATEFGVLRFDGIRAVPWQPSGDQRLPSSDIWSVLAGRDGSLWIGTAKGLARWKGGTLTRYSELSGHFVQTLLEDRSGTVWAAGAAIPTGLLCAVRDSGANCYGKDGMFGYSPWGLYEDRKGTLWVGATGGVWKWQPEPRVFVRTSDDKDVISGFDEDADGALLFATPRSGVRRIVSNKTEPYPMTNLHQPLKPQRLLRDRDGGLWIGTFNQGLVHEHQGKTDQFNQADGLSGQGVTYLFQDRENSIWVVTENGLDRFRDGAVSRLSIKQGLPAALTGVSAASDGGIWMADPFGLAKWTNGDLVAYRARGAPRTRAGAREFVVRGLPEGAVSDVFEDDRQRTWLALPAAFGYLQDDRFVEIAGVSPREVRSIVGDGLGAVWISDQQLGLLRIDPNLQVERTPWSALGHTDFATALAPDRMRGGLWLGLFNGGVAFVKGGKVQASYGPAAGLTGGWVKGLHIDADGAVWVAGEGGLSRLRDGQVTTLTSKNGLPCDAVNWVIQDDAASLWLNMACGLVRIPRQDIAAWGDGRTGSITATVFDAADGVRSESVPAGYAPYVAKAADGRLWFVGPDGASVVDPRHLPFNTLPPPVHVEQIIADHDTYDAARDHVGSIRLPALTRDLQIDYTALSLVAPEKNRFRIKLEGWERDWQNVGNRRQVSYGNLPPRNYRFRVMAANNSGVWNEAGAVLDFAIAPAYYQTVWFRTLSPVMLVALVWVAHRVRVGMIQKHEREISALNERLMKAQEQERIRIAGELHDGVMQEMLAATMMLGSAKHRIPDELEAKAKIERVQEKLIKVGTDLRQLSHDLHPPMLQEAGLPQAVRSYCEQFSASAGVRVSCEADEQARELSRGAALALFRIMQEALGNAAKHAKAKQIAVRLTRTNGEVSLAISDNGVGFDRSRLATAGGLGLITMRERATQLDGTFEFDSAPGRGTTIRVVIPFR